MDATAIDQPSGFEGQIRQAMQFLSIVFDQHDWVEIRLLPCAESQWFQLADSTAVEKALRWAIECNAHKSGAQNVYVGVNPRCASGERKADSVHMARVLFADFDGGMTVAEATARIVAAGLPEPTIMIASGGGVHAY